MRAPSLLAPVALVALVVAVLVAVAGCASLATPEAPGSGTPSPGATGGGTVAVSQQVKDGAQLYVDFACVRCHAPDGVGGIPNRYNTGGDDDIPPLNNAYRDPSERFTNAQQITTVMMEGGILSKKPRVINMPSWKGVINDAQMNAIAAYILAGFPHTSVQVDFDPATGPDIYTGYACIWCHGQVGPNATPPPAPNPASADKVVPFLRNPDDTATLAEFVDFIMNGSVTEPGKKGELIMPAWGQIMSTQQVKTNLPYIQDGPKANKQPPPPAAPTLPLATGGSSSTGASPSPAATGSP
jgi:mono/diheme cytochrome c family protein